MMTLRLLSADDVRQAVPMSQAINVMRLAFGQLSAHQAVVPLRSRLQTEDGLMLLMPAYLQESRALALKAVSIWGDNPAKGLPAVVALVTVFDPDTGQPIALINGEELTALRTGAGGGLAAELLARPDSTIVTVFGAGVQARAQLAGVRAVRAINLVRIVGRNPDHVAQLAAEVRAWATVELPSSPQAAVEGADIVITATNSNSPVFAGEALSAGVHVTAVGSYAPTMQEVDGTTIKRADKVVVDSREASLAEAGDLLIPLEQNIISQADIHGEIGEIVLGKISGRESPHEITYFKSVGVAVQDAAIAAEILHQATAQGLGQLVSL